MHLLTSISFATSTVGRLAGTFGGVTLVAERRIDVEGLKRHGHGFPPRSGHAGCDRR